MICFVKLQGWEDAKLAKVLDCRVGSADGRAGFIKQFAVKAEDTHTGVCPKHFARLFGYAHFRQVELGFYDVAKKQETGNPGHKSKQYQLGNYIRKI